MVPVQCELIAEINRQQGQWRDVARFYLDTVTLSEEVFNLYINHGAAPKNKSYVYAVIPNPSGKTYKKVGKTEVMACNEQCHVVKHGNGTWQIVCFEAGTIPLNEQVKLSVSGPAILGLQPGKNGIWSLSAADPSYRQKEISITFLADGTQEKVRIDTEAQDGATHETTVKLPLL